MLINKDIITKYHPWFVYECESYLVSEYISNILEIILVKGNRNHILKTRRNDNTNGIVLMSLHSYQELFEICQSHLHGLAYKQISDGNHNLMINRDVTNKPKAKSIRSWKIDLNKSTEEQFSIWESFETRYGVSGNLEDAKIFGELGDMLHDYVNSVYYLSAENETAEDTMQRRHNHINKLGPYLMIRGHQHSHSDNFPFTGNDITIIPQLPLRAIANANLGPNLESWDIIMFCLMCQDRRQEFHKRLKMISFQ